MTDSIWICLVAVGVWGLWHIAGTLRAILGSLQSTEAMTRRLLSHQGIDWQTNVEPSDRVRDLAVNPKSHIAAIKAYREQSGLGLKEAKAVVDGLSRAPRDAA